MREIITLVCTIEGCGGRYSTRKNKKTTTERLERAKFCRICRKHTPYREKK